MKNYWEQRAMVRRAPWLDEVEVVLVATDAEGQRFIAQPCVLAPLPRGEVINVPTMSLNLTAAQQLMDGLWECGLRPTEGAGSAGALAATQAHLEDMRKLTFRLIAKE